MSVGLKQPRKLFPVPGVRLAAIHSGLKTNPESTDLVLVEVSEKATLAATFTTNRFCSAPVTVAREHLEKQLLSEHRAIRYLLINSGNANAGTGQQGYQDALICCQAVAELGSSSSEQVLPFRQVLSPPGYLLIRYVRLYPVCLTRSAQTNGWKLLKA